MGSGLLFPIRSTASVFEGSSRRKFFFIQFATLFRARSVVRTRSSSVLPMVRIARSSAKAISLVPSGISMRRIPSYRRFHRVRPRTDSLADPHPPQSDRANSPGRWRSSTVACSSGSVQTRFPPTMPS
jgi:hypothetical protein